MGRVTVLHKTNPVCRCLGEQPSGWTWPRFIESDMCSRGRYMVIPGTFANRILQSDHHISPQLRQVMMPSSGSPGTFPKRRFQSKSCPPLLKVSRSFRFWPNRDSDCRKPSLSNQRATGSSDWVQGTEVIFSLTCFNRVTNFPHFLHQTPPVSFQGKIARPFSI